VAAAHKVLVTYPPYAQATLDERYAASLAQIPDGKAKTRGIALVQYNAALRDQVRVRNLELVDAARMLAAIDMSVADAEISVWYAKYVYGFWRPVGAINLADTDGSPATVADPTWTPLLVTPLYPDYPGGYNVFNSTVTHGLEDLFRTRHLQLTLISTAAPQGSNSPWRTPARKASHSVGEKVSMGPDRSLESRMATCSPRKATSMQPLVPESELLRQTAGMLSMVDTLLSPAAMAGRRLSAAASSHVRCFGLNVRV
jgi:hypothetical protein